MTLRAQLSKLALLVLCSLLGLCSSLAPGLAQTPPQEPAPSVAPAAPTRQKLFDDLFAQLKQAPDAAAAAQVRAMIESVWTHSGSATADLLMARAEAALQHGDGALAQQLLDHVVILYPDWPEGWRRRAQAALALGDAEGAMVDLNHALTVEPRDYLALDALAALMRDSGKNKQALELMRRSLAIDPQDAPLRDATEKLAPEVEGREI